MFSFLNRELKIGNNRKTGIEARQTRKRGNEREGDGEGERRKERETEIQKSK